MLGLLMEELSRLDNFYNSKHLISFDLLLRYCFFKWEILYAPKFLRKSPWFIKIIMRKGALILI